jgi:hypothetical protein
MRPSFNRDVAIFHKIVAESRMGGGLVPSWRVAAILGIFPSEDAYHFNSVAKHVGGAFFRH